MSSGTLISAAEADTAVLLAVLRAAATSIDFSASVAAATSASGAIDISAVSGLSLLAQIDAVSANLSILISTPATLASSLIALVQAFAGTSVDLLQLADQLAAANWTWPWVWNGVYALQIGANRDALQALVTNQALIEAVRASATTTFATQQAAFALGDDLARRIDDAIRNASSRRMRASFRALKTALVADINTRAAQATALVSWVNVGDVPALVLASRIYDDPTMAPDIVARNDIANPLFVGAGMLTILSPGAAS
jgi:prophage DNA circulation protein